MAYDGCIKVSPNRHCLRAISLECTGDWPLLERLDETIVAISSAPGSSPLGLIRLTGPTAWDIVQRAMPASETIHSGSSGEIPSKLDKMPGFSCLQSDIGMNDGDAGVPATIYLFRSPKSYTRQDMVEILVPGSLPVLESVIDNLIRLGARRALPGEFTARAFVNGRISLSEAEGVAQVINARSDSELKAARRMLEGEFARQVATLADQLSALVALIEADIDFAEEPIDFIQPAELVDHLETLRATLTKAIESSARGDQATGLPQIMLLGPTNAGKSSLMNALAASERAICAAVAGTTRDILRAPLNLGGHEAEILDAAGIDHELIDLSSSEREAGIHKESQARAFEAARQADLVCIVVPSGDDIPDSIHALQQSLPHTPFMRIHSKCDLRPNNPITEPDITTPDNPPTWETAVSVVTGQGLDRLKEMLTQQLASLGTTIRQEGLALTSRQLEALREATESLDRGINLAAHAVSVLDCAELLAFELRSALDALGEISGEVTTEALLGRIFSDFCIGK